MTIQNVETIKVLAGIIKTEMSLADNQVIIYNQKFDIPDTEGIFIVLSYVSDKIISNITEIDDRDSAGFFEVQSLVKQEIIGVDIYSRNSDARLRKEEIILAVNTLESKATMLFNGIQIFRVPTSFVDVSFIEAAARLNRFHIDIVTMRTFSKEKQTQYYDKFRGIQGITD